MMALFSTQPGPYFLVLLIIALLFILIPAWRFHSSDELSGREIRRQKNIDVFAQRLQELTEELDADVVSAEEFERLKLETERAFLRDMAELEDEAKTGSLFSAGLFTNKRFSGMLPYMLAVLVTVLSIVFYDSWGSARDLELPELIAGISAAQTEEEQTAALNTLADFLQQRYDRRADDIQNGYMLGTLYLELDRYEEAVSTFSRMLEEMEDSIDKATVYGQLAQAQYMAAGSAMTEQVEATIAEALALNPNEYAVMSILAIDAFLAQNFTDAINYWRKQLLQATPGSREALTLQDRIARVETLLPAEQEVETEVQGPVITLNIDITPELAAQLSDARSLFVYIRNPQMPAPIVAQNLTVPEFPVTVTLDDSNSMLGITLGSLEFAIAGARISFSGQAVGQSGDFQVVTEPFLLAEQDGPLNLLIQEIVP